MLYCGILSRVNTKREPYIVVFVIINMYKYWVANVER